MSYFDLGPYRRTITTSSPEAQLWFDRGLNWVYAYNHAEAIACFQKALAADPGCAMAHWGVAYAAGPNYNLPWHLYDPAGKAAALAAAYDATQGALTALTALDGVDAVEAALIRALPARYPQRTPVDDQDPWNAAYTDAMRAVLADHPQDLDVRAVFVEAIMNETPWKMWDLVAGAPAEGAGTVEAQAALETAFAERAEAWAHPGLLHLYVHLMEMSPTPERALRAADVLRDWAPDAGHLLHMPTHIDVLCGDYSAVVATNARAAAADRRFFAEGAPPGVYTLYAIHNLHFQIYGAMFLGQLQPALAAAEALIALAPEPLLRIPSPPMGDFAEGYVAMKQHVLVRFGAWRELLAQEPPADPDLYCATTAMMLYAQGVAASALGETERAETLRTAFLAAKARVPKSRRVHNNRVIDLLAVAEAMLEGELAYRLGAFDDAFAHLRAAVALEDGLPYDEPWGWMQPARHALGALLLEQGRLEEAEAVYRADLGLDPMLSRACRHPDNVWALHGLNECLTRRGETALQPLIRQRLDRALARADVPIGASCFCRRA